VAGALVEIGSCAFESCSGLKQITLPDSIVDVGRSAFRGCSRLKQITLPSSLLKIDDRVFQGCSGLKQVTLPDTLIEIGDGAFQGCSGLKNVTLPDWLVKIDRGAFSGCSGLEGVTLPAALVEIGSNAFRGCSGLVDVNFHKSSTLQSIAQGTFCKCTSLRALVFPQTVRTIGGEGGFYDGAAEDCTNLTILILPAALTVLGVDSFKGSTANLRLVIVPPTVSTTVATAMAVILGQSTSYNTGHDLDDSSSGEPDQADLRAVSTVQLVCAPDVVVASLGGVFADMMTIAEARVAHRLIANTFDYNQWTVKTHRYQICSSGQQLCAHTVLLVGARLKFQPVSRLRSDSPAVTNGHALLPPLPTELWLEVLTWQS